MDPFYERAEALFHVSGQVYDERIWQKFNIQAPNFDRSKLGYKFTVFSPYPNLGKLYRNEFEKSANIRTLLNANVTQIHTNKSASAVKYLDIRTLEGKTGRVRAKAFVLCGGGIENARLLLLSNRYESNGLGNRHGVVGRFFQEHPNGYSAVLQTDAPILLQDPYSLLYKGGMRYFPKIPLSVEVQRKQRVLNCTSNLVYEYDTDSGVKAAKQIYRSLKKRKWPKELGTEVRRMVMDLDQISTMTYRRYVQGKSPASPPSLICLQTQAEQAPNQRSRVSLSRKRDALGLNQARVDWRLTDLDRRTAETMTTTVGDEFRRLGLAHLRMANWLDDGDKDWADNFSDSYHHMGTTRMAEDPKSGVVDSNCQVHGIAGLYISGSSVFPTSGYANPTLTIAALSIRLADHLKATVPS